MLPVWNGVGMLKTYSIMIPCTHNLQLQHLLRGMEWTVEQSGDTMDRLHGKPCREGNCMALFSS